MTQDLCERFALELPLFAFTASPEVCAAVSLAGGMGVLGAVAYSADELAQHLDWIDAHVDGRPYGVDVVMPVAYAGAESGGVDRGALEAMIPSGHRAWIDELLARHEVPPLPPGEAAHEGLLSWVESLTRAQVEVALAHPVRLVASALGPPPPEVIAHLHERGVPVAALAGSVRHARKSVEAGVDIVVAQGTEAGGHTGEIATMVLVPEVVDAVAPVPVLAAGGIGSGRQVAAALALGAAGAWTGSIWLCASENRMSGPALKRKLVAASAHDTVRSRAISGKPARQLKTAWTEAWDGPGSPGTLPLPLQWMATSEAQTRIHRHAEAGHAGAQALLGSPVGQIVGRMRAVRPAAVIVREIADELRLTLERLGGRRR
jgi:NAD(P)H-dependent flavin oxidoreductase YrpB (nitropropane dioxygenase family)